MNPSAAVQQAARSWVNSFVFISNCSFPETRGKVYETSHCHVFWLWLAFPTAWPSPPRGVTLLMTNPAIFDCRGPGAGHEGTVCSSWPRSAEGSHQQCANTHHVPAFSSPPRGCVHARASLGTGGENKQPCYFVFCLNIRVSAISDMKGGKEKVNKSPQ